MVETYSKEVVKEFALQKLRLIPSTLGKNKNDIPSIVRAIGGLQEGGHKIELFIVSKILNQNGSTTGMNITPQLRVMCYEEP